MSKSVVDFLGLFSGLCGIVAVCLYFITVPREQRTVSFLVTSILIGLPLILLSIGENVWVFSITMVIYTISVVLFSYSYGKAKAEQKNILPDLLLATNKRTSGQEWILNNILQTKTGIINVDAYGVKLDALYKVIKGSTYKSKLPHDVEINMRALLLESNSFGVHSRAKIENNDRIISDVELMKDVWIKLVKEYKKHQYHTLKVKVYEFTPAFYILRVNDRMLVGTYLAESGYENLCFHLAKTDGKTFYQFERFFDRIWNDYSKNIIQTRI